MGYNEPMKCAECDCDNPPQGCNWIKSGPSLADVLELPEIRALVDALVSINALDPEYSRIDGFSENALRGLVLRMGGTSRAALAALQTKGGA